MSFGPVIQLTFNVDGGCRYNGHGNYAYGAAACCLMDGSPHPYRTELLPRTPTPTNQRAELLAMILALEWALEKIQQEWNSPRRASFNFRIRGDSTYARDCLTVWLPAWQGNGWVNSRRQPVANRDLIEIAVRLESQIRQSGSSVDYTQIAREENTEADYRCNEAMNEAQ